MSYEKNGKTFCSYCHNEMQRFTSKKIEKRQRVDGEALGLEWIKGVLACPCYYDLNKGEHWIV